MWFILVSVPWVLEKCVLLLLCASHSGVSDSHVTPQTVTCQAPMSMGFSKQEYSRQGVGSHSLFQGVFLTQGSNLGLLHCRRILYHLRDQGSSCYAGCCINVSQILLVDGIVQSFDVFASFLDRPFTESRVLTSPVIIVNLSVSLQFLLHVF